MARGPSKRRHNPCCRPSLTMWGYTMRTTLTSGMIPIVAWSLLASCTSDSGLPSKGAGGSTNGGSAAGGAGGLGTSSDGGSTGGVTGSGGTTTTNSGGAAGGGGSGLSGGRAGGGTTTTTGGARSGSGGMAGGSGSSAGGSGGWNGGTGGTTICPAITCLLPACQYGTLPSTSPCGCPTCAPPPDAGAPFDAPIEDAHRADGPTVCTAACVLPNCPSGTVKGPPPCSCPICAPIDAGRASDGPIADGPIICAGIACPMIACLNGYVPSPTPCGCPTCAPADAGAGSGVGAACGGANDPACASGTHCEWSDKLCGARTHGACASFPGGVACSISAEPVCGCDGKNYASPCEAARAGVDISSNASCPEPTGLFRCGWSYCQHSVQYCHAQVGGAITNPGSYACNALPAACGGVPSCTCVAGSATISTICNTNANGDVTATLEVP